MCVFSREGESRMSESATLRASWVTARDFRGGQIDGWVEKWCTHYSVVLSHHMTGCYRWSLSCLLYIYSNFKGFMMQSKQDLLCIKICFIRMLKVGYIFLHVAVYSVNKHFVHVENTVTVCVLRIFLVLIVFLKRCFFFHLWTAATSRTWQTSHISPNFSSSYT